MDEEVQKYAEFYETETECKLYVFSGSSLGVVAFGHLRLKGE